MGWIVKRKPATKISIPNAIYLNLSAPAPIVQGFLFTVIAMTMILEITASLYSQPYPYHQ